MIRVIALFALFCGTLPLRAETVVGLVDFGEENGWPDTHTFRLENGKVRYVHTLTVCPNGCQLPSPKEKAKPQ